MKTKSLVAVLLAWARIEYTAASPAAYIPASRVSLLESPYYLVLVHISVQSPRKLFIFIICNNIYWIKYIPVIVDLFFKAKSLVAVLLAWARIPFTAASPAAYIPASRVTLSESPYYLVLFHTSVQSPRKLFIFITCNSVCWIKYIPIIVDLFFKAKSLVAVLLAWARIPCTAASPAAYIPASRVTLLESPYYLPGITNYPVKVPPIPGAGAATVFRLLGAQAGARSQSELALNYEEANRACQDVGLGLAAIFDDRHHDAVNDLLNHARDVQPEGM